MCVVLLIITTFLLVDPNVYQITNQRDFKQHCLDPADKGVSALCLVAFLPPVDEEFEDTIKYRDDLVDTLTTVKRELNDIRLRPSSSSVPNVYFLWTYGHEESKQALLNRFGASTDLPSAFIINPTKRVFRTFIGAFDAASLKEFLLDVAAGRGRVFSYNWDVDFGDSEQAAAQCGGGDASSDDDGQCTKPPTPRDEL